MAHVEQFNLAEADMQAFELDPGDIIAGDPNPRYAVISRASDGTVEVGIFRMSPGRFTFTQAGDEWTLVLKGRITVTAEDGSRIDCKPGDVMQLRDGAVTTYEIHDEYEDYFVIKHQPVLMTEPGDETGRNLSTAPARTCSSALG